MPTPAAVGALTSASLVSQYQMKAVTLALRWTTALLICSAASTGPPCVFLRKSSGHLPTPA
jgi:hypothetical protein